MRVAQVSVNRSEHHSVSLLIGAWEILVLQYEYGPEKIVTEGFKKLEGRGYPDPQKEYERLSLRYGIDTDTGAPKASLVYGQGAIGVLSLRNLIDAERKAEAEEDLEAVNLTQNVVEMPPAPLLADPAAALVPAQPAQPASVEPAKTVLGLPKTAAR